MMPLPSCLLSVNNYFYPRGGAEVLFLEQNRMFESIGWQVVPFAMRHADNLPTPWAAYFPDEIEFGRSYGLGDKFLRAQRVVFSHQAQRRMRALLDHVQPHIAHVHNIYHHLSPSILPLLRKRGIPVVMTVHDLKLACPAYTMIADDKPCERCRGGRIHNVVVHRCIKGSLALSSLVMVETVVHRLLRLYDANVSRFVVPSRFILEKLVQWGWARERFVYIPNFVDIKRFRADGVTGDRFVYCGRLQKLKGVETLVRAAARAKVPLTMVGSGPEENRLRKLSEDLRADVLFLGHRSKEALAKVVQSARAIVVPSEVNENAPLSLLEGYAAGRPVIGSDIAGIPELVRREETGVLFAPGEVEELAAVLDRFAKLPGTRLAEMGAAGRRWVERDFTATCYRDRLLDLYGSLYGAIEKRAVTAIELAAEKSPNADRPLRVTMLGLRGFPNVQGGVENHAQNLSTRLVEAGCDVEVIVRSPYVPKENQRVVGGVKLVRVWSPRTKGFEAFLHTFLGVVRAVWTRPEILHIHSVGPALFTPLARAFALRVVVTHHLPNYENKKWGFMARSILRLGERAGMLCANARIAVSAVLASRIERTYRVPVAVIPNGVVNPRKLQSTTTLTAFGLSLGRYVLTVARIDEQKRQLDLISAFARIGKTDWKLAIVGGADYSSEYARAVAHAASETAGVILLGHQTGDALAELYTHAGVFVLPSDQEGQPIAALEAMSYGCPIILSDIPAHREIGAATAKFVRVGDIAGLAAGLSARFSATTDHRLDVIEQERFMKNHDWRQIAQRTFDVYMAALS